MIYFLSVTNGENLILDLLMRHSDTKMYNCTATMDTNSHREIKKKQLESFHLLDQFNFLHFNWTLSVADTNAMR